MKGSEFYVAHPFMPNEKTKAMLNLESVGRGESIGAGSGRNFPQLWDVMDRMNKKYIHRRVTASAELEPRASPAGRRALPVGERPDDLVRHRRRQAAAYASYHTTKDSLEIITPEIMEDLARLVFLTTVELATK